jgi:membrane protein implicated in regulation of membrane protease activity
MNPLAAFLQGMLRFAVVGVLVFAAIVGIFVAWWVVVFAVLALSAYIGVRKFFGVKPPPTAGPAGTVIIEGEYEVARDAENEHGRASGRVIEVELDQRPPDAGDKNHDSESGR